MHGINIPEGTADPDDRLVKANHTKNRIIAFESKKLLSEDMNDLIVLAYESNMSVASLSNVPSGHKN
jgi:hypothetical protein